MTRIQRIIPGLFVTISLSFGQSAKVKVLKDQRWPSRVVDRVLIVQPFSFTPEAVKELFARELEENNGYRVIRVRVFTDRDAAAGSSKGRTDITYVAWRSLFDDYRTRIPPTAELISINGDASMSIRTPSGKIYSEILSGEDPRALSIDGTEFHLADFMPRTIRVGPLSRTDLSIVFYYWTPGHYDEPNAKDLLANRIATTAISRGTVIVEPWPWFISHEDFPILYAYDSQSEPPTEAEYYSAFKPSCSSDFGDIKCLSFGKRP